jgi:hypothetical protein
METTMALATVVFTVTSLAIALVASVANLIAAVRGK